MGPQFPELAQIIAQTPQLLPQVTQALQQTHPGLQQALASNQLEFLKMVHEVVGSMMSPVSTMLAAVHMTTQGQANQTVRGLTHGNGDLGTGDQWEYDQWGRGGQWGGAPWANDCHWGSGGWASDQWGENHRAN